MDLAWDGKVTAATGKAWGLPNVVREGRCPEAFFLELQTN